MVQLSPNFVFPLTTTCDFILQFSPITTPPESMMEYAPIRNYGVFLHQDVQMLLGERSHQQRSYESRIDSRDLVHCWHALGVFFDMMAGVLRTLLVLSGGFLSGPRTSFEQHPMV